MANRIDVGYAAGAGIDSLQNASVGGREKADLSFCDAMLEKCYPSPEDMTLTEYKMYFHDKVKALYTHPSKRRVDWFIDITDAAYRRMQADPAYEREVLEYLARNKGTSAYGCAPKFVFIHIDDTWDKCYGYAFGIQDDSRAKRAAERRRMAAEAAKKARRKKLLKEYLKKKAEAKRLQDKLYTNQLRKRWLEHSRLNKKWSDQKQFAEVCKEQRAVKQQEQTVLVKEWSEARQAQAARNAYEASLVMMMRQEEQLFT